MTRPLSKRAQAKADRQAADRRRSALEAMGRGFWGIWCVNGRAHGRADGGPRILDCPEAVQRGHYSERGRR